MLRFLTLISVAALSATSAVAQDREGDQPRRERREGDGQPQGEGRRGDRGDGQFRMGGPGGPGGMGRGGQQFMERMLQRTADDLELDDAQKVQFDTLAKPHLDQMKQMAERWAEVREARDAGNDEQATRLQQQLERSSPQPNEAIGTILDEMEPTLRPEQVEKAEAIRNRYQSDTDTRDRMRRIQRDLPEALKLDETQKQQLDELLAASREEMGNRMSGMRPLFEQMREAREANDTAKLRELEKQMESQRPDMTSRYAEFFTQVEAMLREDQKELLANFKDDLGMGEGGTDAKSSSTDVRGLLSAAKRLKLAADQKKELKEIEDDAMKAWREAGRDKQARADLARQVREEIAKMLDQTQTSRFEQLLERMEKRTRK